MYNPKSYLSLLIALLLVFSNSYGQTVAGFDLSKEIPMKKEVRTGKLPNGLTYFVLENRKPENRAELQLVVKAGSVYEDDDQKGLAHFIEHMCFNGTKNFPKNELINFLESTGVRFGADVNASTGFDRTYYTLTIPLDKPGLLDKGLQVLEDWIVNTSFDDEEIEKERGVILEEWRLRGNADFRTFMKHLPYLAYNSKYKDRMPIGDTAIILNAPKEAFLRYYKQFYRPELSAIIAVGDFNGKEVEDLIIKKFSDANQSGPFKQPPYINVPYTHQPLVSIATDPELQMPNVMIMYKHPAEVRGTYGEYRRNLIKNIYNYAINQRLQEISRKPNPPFLYAIAEYGSTGFLGDINALQLVVVPKSENILGGYETILTEAFRVHKHGITNGELERAKKELLSNMESTYNERDKIESMAMAQELYRYFESGESVPGIDKEFELYKTFLPTITLEEVNQFAQGLIRDEGLVITVSAPKKDGITVPTEDEIVNSYRKVENSNIEPYKDFSSDVPLMKNLPKPGTIKSKKEIKELGITEIILSNGARIILKPTDFKNDEVNMSAYAWGGTSTVKDEDYYSASSAASIINQSGIAEFDQTTLNKLLTGKQVSVNPYISELSQGFNGSSTTKDLETFFQLLHLYFTAPRKDKDAFDSYITKFKDQLMNSSLDPNSVFRDTIMAVMGNYHFRRMPWTEETIEYINLDKAFNFYKEKFSGAGNFTFIFVGNINQNEFEKYLTQYIASLPKGKKDNWKDLGINPPKNSFKKIVNKGFEPKSSVRLTINGDFEFNRENRFALGSMIEVLSIRLREVIREDKGGVYGIGARPSFNKYPKPSYQVNISFGTAPNRVEELITAAKEVIEEVKNGKFDDSYVDKVKAILTREYETNIKENWYWMNTISSLSQYGEPLTLIKDYNNYVNKITKDYIVAAAKKYLDMNTFKEFILYPEE